MLSVPLPHCVDDVLVGVLVLVVSVVLVVFGAFECSSSGFWAVLVGFSGLWCL